jgi:glutathione S-transferase
MSFATITVPAAYGFVILGAGIGPFLTNMYLGGTVMAAREKCNVKYPNAYAVPGCESTIWNVSAFLHCNLTCHDFVPSNLLLLSFSPSSIASDHEKADEFNRAQRSHQNYLEILDQYIAMTLLGGLKHPITCAVGSIFFFLGCVLYQKGYTDLSLDPAMARYKKGGAIKSVGVFISLYSTAALAYDVITA